VPVSQWSAVARRSLTGCAAAVHRRHYRHGCRLPQHGTECDLFIGRRRRALRRRRECRARGGLPVYHRPTPAGLTSSCVACCMLLLQHVAVYIRHVAVYISARCFTLACFRCSRTACAAPLWPRCAAPLCCCCVRHVAGLRALTQWLRWVGAAVYAISGAACSTRHIPLHWLTVAQCHCGLTRCAAAHVA
jgi:hypothetical protein